MQPTENIANGEQSTENIAKKIINDCGGDHIGTSYLKLILQFQGIVIL